VTRVCERLKALGAGAIRQLPGLQETVKFRLPSMPAPRREAGLQVGAAARRA
jgi:hypothetical protein